MKKIVVDIYGGDNAPVEIIEGCLLALSQVDDFDIVMCGNQEELVKYTIDEKRNYLR